MSLFVQRSDVSEFRRRFRWIALGMALVFLGLIGRLFQLQILESEDNRAIARENIVRRTTLATTRGIIRDRTGKVLAASRPAYNIYVVPSRLDMAVVWPRLVDYVGMGLDERTRLEQHLLALRASEHKRKDQQILLKEDISRDAVATLATHEAELPGVEVKPTPVRYYPFEEIGSHLLGYMAEVDGDKLTTLRSAGYVEGDRIGVTGVERAWESYLRGTRGWEKVVVDVRGKRRPGGEEIIEEPRRTDPIPGRDLRLTIDVDVEKAMDKAFRGELAGGVVLIDVRTGRILGMYSKPGFDPNAVSGGSGKQVIRDAFRRLYSDPLKPALDKTVSGAYPPGSTFKPFTALAGLEKGLIDPRAQMQCRGGINFGRRYFRCTHVHGAVDLHKAIAESCNVYFFNLAADYGVGMDVIAEMGLKYGLGHKTGLGVNAEASGRMPTKAWMTLHNKGHYQLGFGLNAAIGQGATTSSVLQLALAYAALANGGTLYQPQIVRAVETSNGTVVQEFSPRVRRQIDIRPENLKLVQDALRSGVIEVGGTAYRAWEQARLSGFEIAGKTGTAQVSHHLARGAEAERVWYFNREHAWFAGYAPAKSPEVAVVALVEHGGVGGKHAAPIAFEAVRAYQDYVRGGGAKSPGASRGGPWQRAGRAAQEGAAVSRGDGFASRVRDHFDWALFIAAALIAVIGVMNLYSATSVYHDSRADFYINQIQWLVVGGILGGLLIAIDYRHFERLGYVLYTFGIFTLILVFVLARGVRGAQRWIGFGSFNFQPSEFTKLFLVIALAKYLHDDPRSEGRTLKDLLIPAILTAVPALLILKQPDLGTAMIHIFVFLTIAAMTRVHTKSVLAFVGSVVPGSYIVYEYVLLGYQKDRITSFINPEADLLHRGWHAHHARVAIGDGGVLGSGFMKGTQNQFGFIPDQFSDFPFPVFAEEWGFVGSVALVTLYGFLTIWSIHVASQAKDRFGAVLAVGSAAVIFWHAIINMGMACGVMPVVGVTMPLFSYGGSSVTTMIMAVALVMNVSMRRYAGVPAPDRL